MKKYLAAAALGAAIAQPASAITFPSLTTIYVASGVEDDGAAVETGTAIVITCTNVSGVTTRIRVLFLENDGSIAGDATFNGVLHGASIRTATHPTFLGLETNFGTGQFFAGAVNIESLQSGVFCTFVVVDAWGQGAGFPLNAVRVNPHPGTVE